MDNIIEKFGELFSDCNRIDSENDIVSLINRVNTKLQISSPYKVFDAEMFQFSPKLSMFIDSYDQFDYYYGIEFKSNNNKMITYNMIHFGDCFIGVRIREQTNEDPHTSISHKEYFSLKLTDEHAMFLSLLV